MAVFDADLHRVYQAGIWNVDPQELAQNVYYFETSDDDPATGLGRRVQGRNVRRRGKRERRENRETKQETPVGVLWERACTRRGAGRLCSG